MHIAYIIIQCIIIDDSDNTFLTSPSTSVNITTNNSHCKTSSTPGLHLQYTGSTSLGTTTSSDTTKTHTTLHQSNSKTSPSDLGLSNGPTEGGVSQGSGVLDRLMSIIEEHPLRLHHDEVLSSEYLERSSSISSEGTDVSTGSANDSHTSSNASTVRDKSFPGHPRPDYTLHNEDHTSIIAVGGAKSFHTSGWVRPIDEEVEPSLMLRAAEFSLFEPSQLDDVMRGESIMGRLKGVYEQARPTVVPGGDGGDVVVDVQYSCTDDTCTGDSGDSGGGDVDLCAQGNIDKALPSMVTYT